MKPVDFAYSRPATVEDALAALREFGGAAKVLAGGQSLGPMLNLRLAQPEILVDITGIEELRRVEQRKDAIVIGACVTHADIEDRRVPDVTNGALPSVACNIAYRAVRNRGTVGGSLTHADPSADWVSALAALGAGVVVRGSDGERFVDVSRYMTGALEADIAEGELLVSVTIPRLSEKSRWGYVKFCRKTGEFAHAIGVYLSDPAQGIHRAVIGATEARPIVVEDAREIVNEQGSVDTSAVENLCRTHGMHDVVERRLHVAALKRAVEKAFAQ